MRSLFGSVGARCMSLARQALIPAPLSPSSHPLEEHGCFSSCLHWDLPMPGRVRGRFSAAASESCSAFAALRTGQGLGGAGSVTPAEEGAAHLKTLSTAQLIKLSLGPGWSARAPAPREGPGWVRADMGASPHSLESSTCPSRLDIALSSPE